MKETRRLWALIVALSMVLGMGVPVFAAENTGAEIISEEYTLSLEELELSGPMARSFSVQNYGDKLAPAAKEVYDALLGWIETADTNQIALADMEGQAPQEVMDNLITPVFGALQMDHPEQFYWVDKVAGLSISVRGQAPSWTVTLTFAVIPSYRGADQGNNVYTLDRTRMNAAKSKAQEIVAALPAGAKDYEKVEAFNAWLCANVSYDNAAAGANAPYGDASQIAGALLDGSAVCEGYAKAFKYLCDLTDVDCVLVTGRGNGKNGWEAHMWNYVKLGGAWYMVDATWNESGGEETKYLYIGSNTLNSYGDHQEQSASGITLAAEDFDPNAAPVDPPVDPVDPPAGTAYAVSLGTLTGIQVSGAPATAKAGDTVMLRVTVLEGYQAPFTLSINGKQLDPNAASFTMPAGNVVITGSATPVEAVPTTYSIQIGSQEGVRITADKESAQAGEIVTLNVEILEGYMAPATIKINGVALAEGANSFAMPARNVTVTGSAPVYTNIRSVSIDPASLQLTIGASSVLTASVATRDGSAYTGAYNWSVSSESVAELSEVEGRPEQTVVTALADGSARISVAVDEGVTASIRLRVGNGGVVSGGDDDDDDDDGSAEHGWWDERDTVERENTSNRVSSSRTDERSVVALTQKAVQETAAGQTPAVKLQNVNTIVRSTLQAALKEAGKSGVTFHFDRVKQGAVESRLYLHPSLLKGEEKDVLQLGVTVNTPALKKIFDQYYQNRLHLVTFSQKGGFGGPVEVAVKLNLEGFKTNSLVFYHYDAASNTFYKLTGVRYFIDANGYLHIQNLTNLDTVIVTDGEMVRK